MSVTVQDVAKVPAFRPTRFLPGRARLLALQGARQWGRCAFVGEGGSVGFDVSPLLIHPQITLCGSWATSLGHMEELGERLSRWELHP